MGGGTELCGRKHDGCPFVDKVANANDASIPLGPRRGLIHPRTRPLLSGFPSLMSR